MHAYISIVFCMIFANPDGGDLEPSESSYRPPSCAKIYLRSDSEEEPDL
jgi:hypothetical protein